MRVVMDENVDGGREAFAGLGRVVTMPGREIDTEDASRADALIVRSLTRVDRGLLGGSHVRFVGTATAGTDHVDTAWLASRGIPFAHAAGCNAAAVADWVLAVLAALHAKGRHGFGAGTVGVIGAGEVGSRVAQRLSALGYEVRLCDPPRAEAEGGDGFVDLATALASDVVTLHVPLTDEGPHPTRDLIDAAAVSRLRGGTVLLNAARGGVVDEAALRERLDHGPDLVAAIDTWMDEPRIDTELLARVDIATPHVAGYTLEGRLRGTAMVARAAATRFDVALDWDWRAALPSTPTLDVQRKDGPAGAVAGILRAYDPRSDAARMRQLLQVGREQLATAFDRIRRETPRRREFGSYRIDGDAPAAWINAGFGQGDPADEEAAWVC
jgi:erythronate-4-phosphate dehydrogenase